MNPQFICIILLQLAMVLPVMALPGKEKFKPYLGYHELKKEKGKYGVWSKIDNKWLTEPIYDSVTAVVFKDSIWGLQQNLYMNKFWKGGKFDLIINYTYDDPKDNSNYKRQVYEVKVAVKGIDDFIIADKNVSHTAYSIAYRRGNKWGWYARIAERWGTFADYVSDAIFDDVPLISDKWVDGRSSGLLCSYTIDNKVLLPCGSFVKKYSAMGLTVLEDSAGRMGFIGVGATVLPCYTRIEEQHYVTASSIEYLYKCYYTDGTMDAYGNYGKATPGDVDLFEGEKAYRDGWQQRDSLRREIINKSLIFFCGPNGLGAKTSKGELLLYPAVKYFSISGKHYYCSSHGVGCNKNGLVVTVPTTDTLACNLTTGDYMLDEIEIKYGSGADQVIRVKDISELKPEGNFKIIKCPRCGGDGTEQVAEKVVVKEAETKQVTKPCYSCGDVQVTNGTITTIYTQTYTESYTIPGQTKTEYHDVTCTQCHGKGRIQIGYRYNPDKQIYE